MPPNSDSNDLPVHQLHPSTFFRIARQSSALLPSLRELHHTLDDKFMSYIFLFASPLLDSLLIREIRGFENTIVGPYLATLSSESQMLSQIVLRDGQMSADIFRNAIVHFKQLRSLELSNAVFMRDFVLLEVLGTLPFLENLTLKAIDPASHPANAPENFNSQSGGSNYYFNALESLSVTGSFFLIQHLGFIDSTYLKLIYVYPVLSHVQFNHDRELEDIFAPSMAIIASKLSQSPKTLGIGSVSTAESTRRYALSKSLMTLTTLHEMRTFFIIGWRMENMDADVRRLVMSWPKLRTLRLPLKQSFISLLTLKIIAENCPELRYLDIRLDTSTIPPFDTSTSKSLHHKLEVLTVGSAHPSTEQTQECRIQVTRHLDSFFPYLKSIKMRASLKDVTWSSFVRTPDDLLVSSK